MTNQCNGNEAPEETPAFDRVFRLVRLLEERILAFSILVIAAVTVANVFFRAVLNSSLTFAEELSQSFIIVVTFVGLSYAAGEGRHIRMSALYDQLSTRGRRLLMSVIAAVTAALMFLLAAYSLQYIHTVFVLGTRSPAMDVPYWVLYLPVPVGLMLAGVQYVLTLIRNLTSDEPYLAFHHKDEYQEEPPAGV